MFIHETQVRVRYADTDKMGFAYYGNYPKYYEIARVEGFRSLGFPYKEMEDNGIMLPVFALHVDYKKSAVYDDLITVRTTLKKTPSVRIEFDFEIRNEIGEILVTGNTVLVFMDKVQKRPVKCPEELLRKIEKLND